MDTNQNMNPNAGKENIENIMRKNRENGPIVAHVPNPTFAANQLRNATGLDIDPTTLPPTTPAEEKNQKFVPMASVDAVKNLPNDVGPETIHRVQIPGMPVQEPTPTGTGQTEMMSAEEFMQQNDGQVWAEKIDVEKEGYQRAMEKANANNDVANSALMGILDQAISTEEQRDANAKEITSDPEKYKDKMSVPYDDGQEKNTPIFYVEEERNNRDRGFDPVYDASMRSDDINELMPAYSNSSDTNDSDSDEGTGTTNSDKHETGSSDINPDNPPDPENTKAYAKYIQQLEHVQLKDDPTVITTVKDRQVDIVVSNRNKTGKYLNDQAFMNAVSKFKKDNFATVSVPMVNSGFMIDIVGTGIVDLLQLYARPTENTTVMEYELEKMKTVMKNVVGTHPKINPMDLRNMIHFSDYNMMVWAHVCATMDNIETVSSCEECGKPFRISSTPRNMVINMPELEKRMTDIRNAESVEQFSLLTTNKRIVTSNQFEITIGHPSYADYVRTLTQIRDYAKTLNQVDTNRFFDLVADIYYVRNVKMPNNVITSNVYQTYLAINMLTEGDLVCLQEEIQKMRDKILVPKFGIAKVVCPHCGTSLTDVPFESIEDMLFFHSTVSRMLLVDSEET